MYWVAQGISSMEGKNSAKEATIHRHISQVPGKKGRERGEQRGKGEGKKRGEVSAKGGREGQGVEIRQRLPLFH